MLRTDQILDLARRRQGGISDYRLAKVLGVTQPAVSAYRSGRVKPGNPILARLASLCDLDERLVFVWVAAERADTPEARAVWDGIVEAFERVNPPPDWAHPRHFVAVDNPPPDAGAKAFSRMSSVFAELV